MSNGPCLRLGSTIVSATGPSVVSVGRRKPWWSRAARRIRRPWWWSRKATGESSRRPSRANMTSLIASKSISKDGGRSGYRACSRSRGFRSLPSRSFRSASASLSSSVVRGPEGGRRSRRKRSRRARKMFIRGSPTATRDGRSRNATLCRRTSDTARGRCVNSRDRGSLRRWSVWAGWVSVLLQHQNARSCDSSLSRWGRRHGPPGELSLG